MTTGSILSSETPATAGLFNPIMTIDEWLKRLYELKAVYGGGVGFSLGTSYTPRVRGRSSRDVQNIPANTTAPVASDDALTEGGILQVSTGIWSGSPTSFTYEWFVDDVSAGTDSSYVIQAGDTGLDIYCTVTATNAYGSATADSNTLTAA